MIHFSSIPEPLPIEVYKAHVVASDRAYSLPIFYDFSSYPVLLSVSISAEFNDCVTIILLIFEVDSIHQLMAHRPIGEVVDVLVLMTGHNCLPVLESELAIPFWRQMGRLNPRTNAHFQIS